jgi:hypothetical protein
MLLAAELLPTTVESALSGFGASPAIAVSLLYIHVRVGHTAA